MKKNKFLILGLYALLAVVLILLDQLTKHLTELYLSPLGTSHVFIPGVVAFTSVHNTGAAFGMFSNGFLPLIIVRSAASAAIVFIAIRYHDKLDHALRIALAMIFAGAIGNLIDQIALGYVRDMIEVLFVKFAVFNAADSFICIGAALALIDILFGKGKHIFDEKPRTPKGGE
ncbi:MAG: signal peptidase II [Eubacteriales bacterium]|nr:signal peptidase II [Eubacteriales bacterium]